MDQSQSRMISPQRHRGTKGENQLAEIGAKRVLCLKPSPSLISTLWIDLCVSVPLWFTGSGIGKCQGQSRTISPQRHKGTKPDQSEPGFSSVDRPSCLCAFVVHRIEGREAPRPQSRTISPQRHQGTKPDQSEPGSSSVDCPSCLCAFVVHRIEGREAPRPQSRTISPQRHQGTKPDQSERDFSSVDCPSCLCAFVVQRIEDREAPRPEPDDFTTKTQRHEAGPIRAGFFLRGSTFVSSCLCGSKDWRLGWTKARVGRSHHKDTGAWRTKSNWLLVLPVFDS